MDIATGIYEHYKGQQYRVIGVARHSETEDVLVAYQTLYGARNKGKTLDNVPRNCRNRCSTAAL